MSNEMIDRVAKAIAKSMSANPVRWDDYIPEAKAAIVAMRDPTEEMVKAIDDTLDKGDAGKTKDTTVELWQASIDAALKE